MVPEGTTLLKVVLLSYRQLWIVPFLLDLQKYNEEKGKHGKEKPSHTDETEITQYAVNRDYYRG